MDEITAPGTINYCEARQGGRKKKIGRQWGEGGGRECKRSRNNGEEARKVGERLRGGPEKRWRKNEGGSWETAE